MSLAEDEQIPVGVILIFRGNVHLVKIQGYKNVNDAHVPANVAALAGHHNVQHVLTQMVGQSR